MSIQYQAIQWNPQKRLYDLLLIGGLALYFILFAGISISLFPAITAEILLIRTFGSAAFILLTLILCIGPLARINKRFLPLLYNRRHMGVTTFLLGLFHAILVILTYNVGGDANPLVYIFTSSPFDSQLAWLPFQPFGFFALVTLFLMAATSHDFWLANLTAPVWKALHMLVYVAYCSLAIHVVFGILQAEYSIAYTVLTLASFATVGCLHLWVSLIDRAADKPFDSDVSSESETWVEICAIDEIALNRARIVCLSSERVAVFKYQDNDDTDLIKISAVSNVCQHQNGPLGEGKVIDGCITCPWHGYQYLPQNGRSPEPFIEKIPTFRVKLDGDKVLIDPKPQEAGTAAEPVTFRKVTVS